MDLFFIYLLVVFVVNALLSGLVAWVADQRGRSAGGFFALSFFLSFVIAMIVLIALPNLSGDSSSSSNVYGAADESRDCPYCAESIKPQAVKCRFCGSDVEPIIEEDSGQTEHQLVRSWCPHCKVESLGEAGHPCDICSKQTHSWD
jgi:hypothetical protein